MTPRKFVGLPADAKAHLRREAAHIRSIRLLAHTYPWWRRAASWLIWRSPLRRLVERRFANPYAHVVVVFDPHEQASGSDETASRVRKPRS